MDAGTLSIQKIFGYDRRLIVPLFQRPYVWEKEDQWEPLWDDVRAVADQLLTGNGARPHFLGAIVLDMVPKPTGHLETRLVIDGQQRLTTIQLVLEAFSDFCTVNGIEKFDRALAKLTRNDDPMSEDPNEQFKVWPTNVDQDHFRRVMLAASPADLLKQYGRSHNAKTAGQTLADAYLFFYRRVEEWLAPDEPGLMTRVEALYNALREKIRLVVIDLEKEDDAQLIFETLNARGTPLLPSDLVKNFLFHRAQMEGRDIDPLYNRYWAPFDRDGEYWRKELGRGHARRARIDTFLQHYLTLTTREEIHVAQVFNTFRGHVQDTAEETRAEGHLASLHDYAGVYRSFDHLPEHSRQAVFFDRLEAMEYSTAYPFLLELFHAHGENQDELKAVLSDLESFLVRRMVCGLNTRGYGRLFIELLIVLSEEGGTPASRIRRFLLMSQAEGRRWPGDRELWEAWLGAPVYRTLVRKRVRMLLDALERELVTPLSETLSFGEKLTVEHLMPQHWEAHWPLPEGLDPEQTRSRRDQLVHTLGNLTLVTKSLNPTLSDGPWEKKKPAILEHSGLTLNRHLSDAEVWDEEAITKRAARLFDTARAVWPHPEGE